MREASLCRGIFTVAWRAGSRTLGAWGKVGDGDVDFHHFFFHFFFPFLFIYLISLLVLHPSTIHHIHNELLIIVLSPRKKKVACGDSNTGVLVNSPQLVMVFWSAHSNQLCPTVITAHAHTVKLLHPTATTYHPPAEMRTHNLHTTCTQLAFNPIALTPGIYTTDYLTSYQPRAAS